MKVKQVKHVFSFDKYRAINVSPDIFKVFEYCLYSLISIVLSSLVIFSLVLRIILYCYFCHAIFLLNEVTDYFVNHGGMASLDARKAFDRANHAKLFNILIDRSARVKVYWYGKPSVLME